MPRKAPLTLAERYRAHREAFNLAQAEGITPAEAAERLKHRAAIAKAREAEARLAAKIHGRPIPHANETPVEQPWMFRD